MFTPVCGTAQCLRSGGAWADILNGDISAVLVGLVCIHVCVRLQDYPSALRVTVRGEATLKLITDQSHIKMDSQTSMVSEEDGDDDEDGGADLVFIE